MQVVASDEFDVSRLAALRELLDDAYDGRFADEDWEHALGGTHFFVESQIGLVSHACVVPRVLSTNGVDLKTGYVEAVATHRAHRRQGLGSLVLTEVGAFIARSFDLGALSTGENAFYARLGWETWRGPTFVRTADGLLRTEHEDGNVMILRTPGSATLDLTSPISCDHRTGDVW